MYPVGVRQIVLIVSAFCLLPFAFTAVSAQRKPAPIQTFSVVQTFPHDPSAFTQGLVFADGEFLESTGLQGESSLRRVEITTGKVLQQITVPSQYFAEGLALVGDELLQLTWQHHMGFVYDRKTFKQKRTFPYKTEGWGIAYDGANLANELYNTQQNATRDALGRGAVFTVPTIIDG